MAGPLSSIPPISGKVSVSIEASQTSQRGDDANRQKTYDAAVGHAKDQLRSRNVTSDQALSADFHPPKPTNGASRTGEDRSPARKRR